MSSILKALRKLETAPADAVEPKSRQYGSLPFRAGRSTPPPKRRRLYRYGVAAAFIFVGGAYFGMQRPAEDPAQIAVHTLPIPMPPAVAPPPPSAPIPEPAAELPKLPAAGPAPETPGKPLSVSVKESLPPASAPPKRPVSPPLPASPPSRAAVPVPPASKAEASTEPESWKRLPAGSDKFALQAIAWSENPGERFIVLNEKILRAGAEIDDFTLAGIEEKYILLRKGKEEFRLDFRLR